MNCIRMLALVAGAALLHAAPAAAKDSHVYAGVTGGTLGIGPEIGYRLNKTFGARASATFLGVSGNIDSNDVTYDGSFDLESYGAMVDVYPFGGGLRVSGGFRINRNRAAAAGEPTSGTFTFNGVDYDSTTLVTGARTSVEVDDFAPALTVGYAGGSRKGFVFGIEAGALFQGTARIQPISVTGTCADPAANPACATIVADLEAERQSVQDDVDGYDIYPILQLTVGYRF